MRVAEKKIAKITIFLPNNGHFTPLPSRNTARFIIRYNKLFPIFLLSLVRGKNALLYFHEFRGKREREHASVNVKLMKFPNQLIEFYKLNLPF